MSRYTDASCRICRRENTKLFLKGDRCYFEKCSFERRAVPPGQHGARRGKVSEYGLQLREKQKVKRSFGLMEKQFHSLFVKAERQQGITGANLLVLLERRLDNTIYRLGFSASRAQARQLVRHGHFTVNDRKVNIPSFLVDEGDIIGVRKKSQKVQMILDSMETVARRGLPTWLEMDKISFTGTVKVLPEREDLIDNISEQLIVELYSK